MAFTFTSRDEEIKERGACNSLEQFNYTELPKQEEPTQKVDTPINEGLDCNGKVTFLQPGIEIHETEAVSEDDRRFWLEIKCLSEIAKCTQNIEDMEEEISDLKSRQKDCKDFLKGETIRLRRLGSELKDIIEGKPLPVESGIKETPQTVFASSVTESGSWRSMPIEEAMDGVKGLGKSKMEKLANEATTLGKLEDLRGEASLQHKSFRELLPKGFGQTLADAMENRLTELVAKSANADTPSAEEQVKLRVAEESIEDEHGDEQSDDESSEAHLPADGDEYEDL